MPHELTWTAARDPAQRRLDQLEELLACFQNALGHELPIQLVAAQGLARLLEQDLGGQLDAEKAGYLDRLAKVVRKTDALVRTLADIGRLNRESGPMMMTPLDDAVREATTEVKLLCPRRSIQYHLQDKMASVRVPRRLLQFALFHLVRNAVESVDESRAAEIGITTETTAEGVALAIVDNGRGLSEAELARLFLPFSGSATTVGQGLGLFLVRQAVHLWGGGIRVRSEPGHGSTFILLFSYPQPE